MYVEGGQYLGNISMYTSGTTELPHLHFGINSEFPTYLGYTPTRKCDEYMGFVDPEKFLTSHAPFDLQKKIDEIWKFLKTLQSQLLAAFRL